MAECIVDGCEKKSRIHKMCVMHYKRKKRNGSPLVTKIGHIQEQIACLLSATTDECIRWPYYHGKDGRPFASINRRSKTVARFLLIGKTGIDPLKIDAAHNCGNKWCVNHLHLYWATRKQNEKDKLSHGTYYNKSSRINGQDAIAIFLSNEPADVAAKKYGLVKETIWQIRRGDTWKRYTDHLPRR